jgi:hypothetical protein
MRKQLLAVALLAVTMIAAARGPDPIITVDGAAAAAKLSPEQKAALAPQLTALNAGLGKVAAAVKTSHTATAEQRAKVHASLQGVHEECMRLYHEIIQQLDPEQRAMFVAYLHQQLEAAGIDPVQLHGAGHPGHGAMPHGGDGPSGA